MRYYVCGFLFTPIRQQVALIKKVRPVWQAGLFNGIGGKVEVGEHPSMAMPREFQEETGVGVHPWVHFCTIINPAEKSLSTPSGPWTVYFYKCFTPVATLQSPTEETVRWWDINQVKGNVYFVPNLQWLIPMALEDIHAEVTQLNWPHEQ